MQAWQGQVSSWAAPPRTMAAPGPIAAVHGSQLRSCSLQAPANRAPDRGNRSPRPQTSRPGRAPSYTHLYQQGSPTGNANASSPTILGAGSVGGMSVGGGAPAGGARAATAPHDGHDEAQVNDMHNSLLQHIQSVQREISRLQSERQRTQQGQQERPRQHAPDEAGAITNIAISGAPTQTPAVVSSAQPTSTVCSPQSSTRNFSAQRERPVGTERVRRSSRREANGSTSAIASTVASTSMRSFGGLERERRISGGHHHRADVGARAVATSSALYSAAPVTRAVDLPTSPKPSSKRVAAAVRIQRFWRQRALKKRITRRPSRPSRGSTAPRQASGPRILTQPKRRTGPVNIAAGTIQRAWKVYRWRRSFVDFSEKQVRWVGSLEWLQRHNLLYGTELADEEDAFVWKSNRNIAPLDREVDPWGSERLLEHLTRMWYGTSRAELVEQQMQQQLQQQQLQQRQAEKQILSERHQQRAKHNFERSQEWQGREQRCDDIFAAFGSTAQDPPVMAAAVPHWGSTDATRQSEVPHGATATVPNISGGHSHSKLAGVPGSSGSSQLRVVPSSDRAVAHRQVSVASMTSMGKAVSLHHGTGPQRGPQPARGWEAVPKAGFRVASHSPPQTHRAPRATVPAATTSVVGSVALRPRSPAQSARGALQCHRYKSPGPSRLSLQSSNSMQARSFPHVQRQSAAAGQTVSQSMLSRAPTAPSTATAAVAH